MQVKDLQLKRVLRTALLFLLLSVAGIGKTFAANAEFYAVINGSVWGFNNVDTELHTVEVAAASGSNIIIPSTFNWSNIDYTVVGIAANAFYVSGSSSSNLASVTIPNTVTYIGNGAFRNCTKLTSIEIPESVTSIGEGVFAWCSKLTSITFTAPSSLASIGASAFFSSAITFIDIPNTVTYIGERAFNSCYGLTTIILPNSVTTIENETFGGCSYLSSIELPNALTSIGELAFEACVELVSIDLPNTLETIGDKAFWGCSGFTSFTLPASVTSVGEGILAYCGLNDITVAEGNTVYDSRDNSHAIIETATNILLAGSNNTLLPSDITAIGAYAFSRCSGLTSIDIPNTVVSIGNNAFANCSGLITLTIPDLVTSIGDYTFAGCTSLISISMGNAVETIGNNAFQQCSSLTTLNIPQSVTSIGEYAFWYNPNLATVNMFPVSVPTLGGYYEFYGTSSSLVIYVPYESLDAYKTAEFWSDYADIMQPMAYKSVTGYGTGNGNWAFIASPLATNTAPDGVGIENMITETTYDLYRFNQSATLEWENYKAEGDHYHFTLGNGQGYLYANVEDVNVMFKGEFNEEETKEVGLVYDANATFAGWNLVGNPFPVSAYANKSYYVMNEEGSAIEPVAVSMETAIPACTGVMVKADATGETVTFSKIVPETQDRNNGMLQVIVAQANTHGNAEEDKAIVSFNAGDALEKFVFNSDNAQLSIKQGGKDLAIACADKQGEMPLNFKAAKNGNYMLAVNTENIEMDYLHLVDNLTGNDIDLLATPNYTFGANTTDYASRFKLVFMPKEDGASTSSATFGYYVDGRLVIPSIEGVQTLQVVDMLGRIVMNENVTGSYDKQLNLTSGVYVVRLNEQTQKIVVK